LFYDKNNIELNSSGASQGIDIGLQEMVRNQNGGLGNLIIAVQNPWHEKKRFSYRNILRYRQGALQGVCSSRLECNCHQAQPGQRQRVNQIGHIWATALDVEKTGTINEEIACGIYRFSKIDVLINNAGQVHSGPLKLPQKKSIRNLFEVNLFGIVQVKRQSCLIVANKKTTLSSM
jgi:hypothetical protein